MKINCTLDDKEITLPKYESVCASGMDLRAWKFSWSDNLKETNDFPEIGIQVYPMERVLIKTGIHIELPQDIEAQIRPRSGLALKNGISIVNSPGTIDEDYRGDIGVILINLGNEPFNIKKEDRIAQIVFQKVEKFNLNIIDQLSETLRSEKGFGSSGKG
jgi:dUTP pyrophosphatase